MMLYSFQKCIKKCVQDRAWSEFRKKIVSQIRRFRLNKKQIRQIYKELRKTIEGTRIADEPICFNIQSNKAFWNKQYLENIGRAILCGDTNEKLVLHFWHVSNTLKWKNPKYILKLIIILLIFITIFTIILYFTSRSYL